MTIGFCTVYWIPFSKFIIYVYLSSFFSLIQASNNLNYKETWVCHIHFEPWTIRPRNGGTLGMRWPSKPQPNTPPQNTVKLGLFWYLKWNWVQIYKKFPFLIIYYWCKIDFSFYTFFMVRPHTYNPHSATDKTRSQYPSWRLHDKVNWHALTAVKIYL